jgi:hypothetical protein
VPITGNNPNVATKFILNGTEASACPVILASGKPMSLAQGGHCILQVHFQPTATGSLSATVTAAEKALNGMAPACTVQSLSTHWRVLTYPKN